MKPQRQLLGIPRKIVGFHLDERLEWVADLECGHQRYVRHNPPWTDRHWVTTFHDRMAHIGHELDCFACQLKDIEEVRRVRVRQLFEARPSEERTETGVVLFYRWLQQSHPELLPTERVAPWTEPRDPYKQLKVDLKGLYK